MWSEAEVTESTDYIGVTRTLSGVFNDRILKRKLQCAEEPDGR